MKISTDDQTPGPIVTLETAKKHAKWLAELGVDGLEIASGNLLYAHMTMWHGDVPPFCPGTIPGKKNPKR